jgi:hypothetical protein
MGVSCLALVVLGAKILERLGATSCDAIVAAKKSFQLSGKKSTGADTRMKAQ